MKIRWCYPCISEFLKLLPCMTLLTIIRLAHRLGTSFLVLQVFLLILLKFQKFIILNN